VKPVGSRIEWAELLRRIYLVNVLACPCGGRRAIVADISEREVVVAILAHLGAASVCAADRAGAESRLRFYVNGNSSSRPKARGRREGEGVPRERCTRGSGARRCSFSVVARRGGGRGRGRGCGIGLAWPSLQTLGCRRLHRA
jgi:hypothetical protein